MKPTIYDVAKKAGVGIGTVSRVINNSSQITPETKSRVLKVIRDLRYQPHAMARGLAQNKSLMVAIILPSFTGYFYLELLRGIQQEISEHSYDIVLYNVDNPERIDIFMNRILRERRVDGMLLVSMSISEKYKDRFLRANFPIVLVDSFHKELDSVSVENEQGAYLATKHLIDQGHNKIGMIDAQLKSTPAKIRLQGYKKALKDHHLPFNKNYLLISDADTDKDGFNRQAGYEAMKQMLAMPDRPTAVFISSDVQAAGAIRALQEAGLTIPRDMAIVGFDDIELAQYLGLTTIHQPLYEMGRLAVHRLMERIKGKLPEHLDKHFSTHLVIRDSCGAKASSNSNTSAGNR
ncbi:LacI family DNA-binding transcriptional regulator [bacterium]|nr:LacI family DNA-binding transcriptional regulator [bacterium]